jgi:6-phosphogluconolactonase (cycloisomerase 2 family)
MVVSPNKEFLYVGVRPEFRVLAYRIAPDNGALTLPAKRRCRAARRIFLPIIRAALSSALPITRAA